MNEISNFQKLQYYKEEIRTEFNLIAMRSTILVTCQSFLVVPFALLQTAAVYASVAVYVYIVAALGIFTSVVLIQPLNAAHKTIDKWLVKQRKLLQNNPDMADLAIGRDYIPGSGDDPSKDKLYKGSLAFSVYGPWSFVIFWILMCVWSTVRLVMHI